MVIGIIGAMEEEVEILIREMSLKRKEIKACMEFNMGELWGKDVVVVRSGIGKVNAAICTQILIDDFDVDTVINVGIAGGIGENIIPGDVVIGERLIQHDVDATGFGYRIGQIPRVDTFDFQSNKELILKAKEACKKIENFNTYIGTIVTGDQFVADVSKIRWLNSEFGALACEMEGGSIAQVCYQNNTPFVVIRSISDNANNGAHMDYEKFKYIAVENSINILKNMLDLCR